MKRRIAWLLTAVLVWTAIPMQAMAYQVPEVVRVGLESVCKNGSSATIGAGTLFLGEERNGAFVEGGSVESNSNYRVTAATGDFIALTDTMECTEAVDLAQALSYLGFHAMAAYLGGDSWTIYIKDASLADVEEQALCVAERVSGFQGYLLSGEVSVLLPEDAVIVGENALTQINGKSYRGMLTFAINGGLLTAVNIVSLEEYLYGVVPSEMPASYETEALKAQAVAARTYAMTKLGAHKSAGYQLCDTTACQVYRGYQNEAARTTAAVDATEGVVACYQGEPIEAVFCASMGGYTENSENVWNMAVPYLQAVSEEGEYGDSSWTRTFTTSQLTSLTSGTGIGTVQDIVITKLSSGGRIQELQIVGTNGRKTLTKEAVRTYFSGAGGSLPSKLFTINGKGGDPDKASFWDTVTKAEDPDTVPEGTLLAAAREQGIVAKTEGTLASLNGKTFSLPIEQEESEQKAEPIVSANGYQEVNVSISTVKNGTFLFEGKGNGHGVGLSQNGAQAMAQNGASYQEILKHYYTDITVR